MRFVIAASSIVLAAIPALVAAGCGGERIEAVEPVPLKAEPTTAGSAAEGGLVYQVWFTAGESLFVAWREHEITPRVATAALEDLLAGPGPAERAEGIHTAVPAGTRLLGLVIAHGVATVDLSSEFESGGGSLLMTARLAQVVCTLDQFPTVEGVLLKLDGRPVDVFSGEGIVLDHPVGCTAYEQLVPVIVVEHPRPGERVGNPLVVSGSADVFEANVTVRILDAAGNQIARTFTTATCGTGCRGSFSVSILYEVATDQEGTIVVQDDDAAGVGRSPHEVRVPVVLTKDS